MCLVEWTEGEISCTRTQLLVSILYIGESFVRLLKRYVKLVCSTK